MNDNLHEDTLIIDIHTHCFPDDLAPKAVNMLAGKAGIPPHTDGTIAGLKQSMKAAGIHISVIQPIATRPEQTAGINRWAAYVRGSRIIAFGTIHPDYANWEEEIKWLAHAGIKGVKFHPDYQEFFVDEPRLYPIYEKLFESGLIALFHAGIDIGLPGPCHCPPARLKKVMDAFPGAPIIAAHMGGYECWSEVEEFLLGRDIYLDTSYSFKDLGPKRMEQIIKGHGAKKIVFGTDSPWGNQSQEISNISSLNLSSDEVSLIMGQNAARLLHLQQSHR